MLQLVFIAFLLVTPTLKADEIPGPSLFSERMSYSPLEMKKGEKTEAEVERQRSGFTGMVPIPSEVLGGLLLGKADYVDEIRHVRGGGINPSPATFGASRSSLFGIGAVYLPHVQEGAPRYFFALERFSEIRHPKETPTMLQADIGLTIAGPDMPFNVRFSPSDQTTTTLLLEGRQYPGLNTLIFVLGHRIKQRSGFFLDIAFPVLFQLGYESPSRVFDTYAGMRLDSRIAPFFTENEKGFWDGFSESRHIGARVRVSPPFFISLEGGYQRETMRSINMQGDELSVHQTKLVPWAKIALETRFQNP